MKLKVIKSVAIICLQVGLLPSQSNYDFDSLLQHDPGFKFMVQQVFDTFQVFGPEEALELTISTDFKSLTKNKYKDEYQPALVLYKLWDSVNIYREIRIKPRGERRLKLCNQAPLWINVKKTEEVFQLMDDLDKLKLVVPCRSPNMYQQYVFSEYLVYKLYNVITDNSFKVRMVRVNYSDTSGKLKPGHSYTFIIESHKSLAKRRQSMPIKNKDLGMKMIDPESAALLYLFQFMVGNTDWSINDLHNIKLLKTLDPMIPNPIAVPYDFDYAGLVNTYYAVPGEHVDVDKVTEREYVGNCLPDEVMNDAIDQFLSKKSEVMALVEELNYLTRGQKKVSLNYLEEFFEILEDPDRYRYEILQHCYN